MASLIDACSMSDHLYYLQYTVFEQLKNLVVRTRTAKLRAGGAKTAVAVLSDLDFFWLGAVSKLGRALSLMLTYVISSFL